MTIQINEPKNQQPEFALFKLGFRPFFILAGIFAIVLLMIWLNQLSEHTIYTRYYPFVLWHSHEMLFGYAMAVIAGFLLTAVGNWTGIRMLHGRPLLLLSLLWLAGRLLPFVAIIPDWLVAIVDLLFIPLVAVAIAIPLVKAKNKNNYIFVALLILMGLCNLQIHLSLFGIVDLAEITGTRLMLYLVLMFIVLMGGRVIPFFTERGLDNVTVSKWPIVENLSVASIVVLALADVFISNKMIVGTVAVITAVLHGWRLAGWYTGKMFRVPLVWILQVGYLWIVTGLLLKALALFDMTAEVLSYHAFAVGGIGVITMGMMARVSLGHTGRQLQVNNSVLAAFILINLAAIVRVIFPAILQQDYMMFVLISGWVWCIAFVLFIVNFFPVLISPRVDGREI